MKHYLIIICLIFSSSIFAQSKDFYRLFDYANNAPSRKTKSIESLSKYFKKGAKSQKELAELIYFWISNNIAYDVESYINNLDIDVSAENTFLTRKTVCSGYANLFLEFCYRVNLDCEVIDGFAKGYGFNGEKVQKPNHAWNAVKINNKWELIDVTWGAGYVDNEEGILSFRKLFCSRYLFDKPDDFILEHFPVDSKWQLTRKTVSIKEFYSQEMETKRIKRIGFWTEE